MTASLRVVSPGLLTTVQDRGRIGYQSLGVPVSGAMDLLSFEAANAIVGNPPGTEAFEIAYQGPTFAIESGSLRIAYVGGEAAIEIVARTGETRRLPPLQSERLVAGDLLRVGALVGSAIGYLAIEGGIDVPMFLGSRATLTRGGIGGYKGRALAAGDIVALRRAEAPVRDEVRLPSLDLSCPKRYRVVLGPQADYFTTEAIATLLSATYTITPATDRMGMRVEGPKLQHDPALGFDIVSDGIAPGTIQVPGNGLPIILLADRQTTGGYPKIATVISADLPALGRLRPGGQVAFEKVSVEEAQALYRIMAREIGRLADRLEPVPPQVRIDLDQLYSRNLVSGVVDAKR